MLSKISATPARKKSHSQLEQHSNPFLRFAELGGACPPVMRLGLATRGNTHLTADDVALAVGRGVNYLNWCGYDDAIASALRGGFVDRKSVVIAMQLGSRKASSAARELEDAFHMLGTDHIDVVTFYYVERRSEWDEIISPEGAMRILKEAKVHGRVGLIGLTSHQRKLAAECAGENKLDLLMIRYNAAHRGAERDIFPVTERLGMPVVVYTAQRWGALKRPTESDPPGFKPPVATEWYRFALAHPSVSAVLMAPQNRREMEENLTLLDDWRAPTAEEFDRMAEHGLRVRRNTGRFP